VATKTPETQWSHCLEPLSSEEVSKYLAESGPKLAALREAVDTDTVLQELAQTPLMLSIMSLAFQGSVGDELATHKGDSAEERRKQIFGLYVEQMFRRKGTASLVFLKEKVIGWLSWLAGKMREHSQSVFLVEGLQPSWLGTRTKRVAYGTVVALSLGLIFALIFALTGALKVWLMVGLIISVGVELGCWSESPLRNGVTSGLIGGLITGLTCELIDVLTGGLSRRLSELICGLLFGLIAGLIARVGAGSLNNITLVETISWKWNQFWNGTIPGLIVGLIFGLIVGLDRGGSAVIKHYALRLTLWLNGYTPFRFIKFLDHCARLILLKKVGGGYIFIHRMLLEYFAELPDQPPRAEDRTTGSVGP
jgi:hypothetical protein